MSTERRMVLFVVLSIATMFGMQFAMERMGLVPKRRPPANNVARANAKPAAEPPKENAQPPEKIAGADDKTNAAEKAADEPKDKPEIATPAPAVELVPKDQLVLGALGGDYLLEAQLDQRGAGVSLLRSATIEAEYQKGQPRNRPLEFIRRDPTAAPSFSMSLVAPADLAPAKKAAEGKGNGKGDDGPPPAADADAADIPTPMIIQELDGVLWEVVKDDQGRVVRPIQKEDPATKSKREGQEIHFRASVEEPKPLTVTRVYRLWKGEEGFEMDLGFRSAEDQTISYRMVGPHGIPIEGEWYTATFRDVFFVGNPSNGKIPTLSAHDVVKRKDDPERFTSLPLKLTGVENQYFAVFVEPRPTPETLQESKIAEVQPVVVHEDVKETQKSDVSVRLLSKPFELGPNRAVEHRYRVYAGPKTKDALAAFDATDLASYRKGWSLPLVGDLGASFMAKTVIAPMLTVVYAGTQRVARLFGGTKGNYGIAIILLTMTVRLILLPLGRKQAKAAKKMQDLQPHMAELKTKHGDDKEAITRETLALYKRHGVNPAAGCLPALIQLPVLIGLWQALNNSVALRHSSFLWIDNLAAPDMLFEFPFPIPIIGRFLGPYFNLLPLLVVGLMLVQTKLFSPPPTTPEAEMQQKTMKFMMIFMMFMFYKVPSGLGIYFITSSLWQIGERLLLPKTTPAALPTTTEPEADRGGKDRPNGTAGKDRAPAVTVGATAGDGKPRGGLIGRFQDWATQFIEEAEKQRTVRNAGDQRDRDRDRDRDRPRPRPNRNR